MHAFGRCLAVFLFFLAPAAVLAQFVDNNGRSRLRFAARPRRRLLLARHRPHRRRPARGSHPRRPLPFARSESRGRHAGRRRPRRRRRPDHASSSTSTAVGRNVAVTAVDATAPRRFNFENDVEPLLSRYGCNSSGCHGKAEGQNGFKLSVFGFDPAADYAALVKEGRGRRVFPAAPEHSLVLRKMSGRIAHGGGVRIAGRLRRLRDAARPGSPPACRSASRPIPKATAVRVEPRERVLTPHGKQQLRVVARYSDGREADVTAQAKFQSNNDGLASVQPDGLVTAGDVPGEAAIMASFMNQVDLFRVVVPRAERIDPYPDVPENNFIDRLVFQKLRKLNIVPSDLADDAEYLRRVYLDVIGTLPTADEARRFLDDRRPDKRARLVDELLERPEYADYWSSAMERPAARGPAGAGAEAGLRLLQVDARVRWRRTSRSTSSPAPS